VPWDIRWRGIPEEGGGVSGRVMQPPAGEAALLGLCTSVLFCVLDCFRFDRRMMIDCTLIQNVHYITMEGGAMMPWALLEDAGGWPISLLSPREESFTIRWLDPSVPLPPAGGGPHGAPPPGCSTRSSASGPRTPHPRPSLYTIFVHTNTTAHRTHILRIPKPPRRPPTANPIRSIFLIGITIH